MQLAGQETLLDWIFSGAFARFPNLKLCLSENGIGWIPAVLETAEWLLNMQRERVTHPADDENEPLMGQLARKMATLNVDRRAREAMLAISPKQLFRDHVFGCFINDDHGVRCIEEIGIDNVMIETDFPHTATWWPNSLDKALEGLGRLSPENRRKVLRGNAERVFNFVPTEPDVAPAPPLAFA
jgi:predicted TIM-barrel fold metal-dependent hydrolase